MLCDLVDAKLKAAGDASRNILIMERAELHTVAENAYNCKKMTRK